MSQAATQASEKVTTLTNLQEPPKVSGLPLLGQSLRLAANPELALQKMYDQYGPVFQFNASHFNYIVMAGPDANDFVNGEGKHFFTGKKFWGSFVEELNSPNAIVALDGENHQKIRRMMKPGLARKIVEENIPDVVDIVKKAFDQNSPGDEVPFVYAAQKLSSNIVGKLLMDTIPTDEDLKQLFFYANNLTILLAVLRLPRLVLKLRGPRFSRAKAATRDLIERVLARALTQPHSRKLFVDTMVEARQKFPEIMTDGDVDASAFIAFFGGIDTLGQTTTFMLWELLRHPEVMERVQGEVDRIYSAADGVPTASNLLNDLPLCHAVFAEALRLHPTGFGIVRNAAEEFEFKGHRIPKGRDILIYTTICHRMDEYFPNPLKFDIDRYSPERQEDRQRGVYAPFGRGPHKCLGASWADAQAVLMLATILYNFNFELPPRMVNATKLMRTTPTLGHKFRIRYLGRRN